MKRKNSKAVAGAVRSLRPTLLALAVSQTLVAPVVAAAVFDASNIAELRSAIASANSNNEADTINIIDSFTVDDDDISQPGNAIPFVSSNITINGNSHEISRASATPFRFATVSTAQGDLTINDLSISNGYLNGFQGGAVFVSESTNLTLNNVTLESNGVNNSNGGAIYSKGTVTINDSTLDNNSASGGGGVFSDEGSLTIFGSTISGNLASSTGGGIESKAGSLSLSSSTVSGNSANNGGGIRAFSSSVDLSNSTVSSNLAGSGGGIHAYGTNLSLSNSTVSDNSAPANGGGIYVSSGLYSSSSSVSLTNTIIAVSLGGGDCIIAGTSSITADNQNIIQDGSCNTSALSIDPQLGPLQNNGGQTQTHALLSNSPAIDVGDNAVCAATPISNLDQRGFQHLGVCDIGSYEFNSPGPPVPPPPPFNPATVVPQIMLLLEEEET